MTTRDTPDRRNSRIDRARRLTEQARAADVRGEAELALQHFDGAIALLQTGPQHVLLADALRWKGTTHRERGETRLAVELYERSYGVARGVGARPAQAHALNCLGIVAQRRGDFNSAEVYYERAARLAEEATDVQLLGMIGQNRGVMANIQGRHDEAQQR